jgi:V/A-type H+/Na+-transporting ATPase subunit E
MSSSSSALERTVNKVLAQTEAELIKQLDYAYEESINNLESSRAKLQDEYQRIVNGAKKQAENLKRQIVGSSRLAARNKQLLLIETSVNEAFENAKAKLASSYKQQNYRDLLTKMVEGSVSAMESESVIVECNENDYNIVKDSIKNLRDKRSRVALSDQPISVIGGIRVKSVDGSVTYDNTLDSRIERLKPLIRKRIVQMFRGERITEW